VRCRRKGGSEQRGSGLLFACRKLLVSIGELLSTRMELLALEAREEVLRLLRSAALLLLAAVFLAFMLAGASAFLIMFFWDSHRLLALGVLTAVYALAALVCMLSLRRLLQGRPFRATREELRLDLERIGGVDRGRDR
jgi:uncharacterized membrane protein YqjE